MIKLQRIIVADRIYGPFANIQTLDDRYVADGCEMQFSVIGNSSVILIGLPAGFKADAYDYVDGALVAKPIDPAVLADLKQKAIAQTYTDVDAIYDAAIGSRGPEYTNAEAAALAYQAAGYTGTVSPYISDYAQSNSTGVVQSNQWSAEAIIAQANGLRTAQITLRGQRFDTQKTIRAATSKADIDTAMAGWSSVIAVVRSSLGLPPV